jgi:hypothetical protein
MAALLATFLSFHSKSVGFSCVFYTELPHSRQWEMLNFSIIFPASSRRNGLTKSVYRKPVSKFSAALRCRIFGKEEPCLYTVGKPMPRVRR